MGARANLQGQVFGRLTARTLTAKRGGTHAYWLCSCLCGRETVVSATHLKTGHTTSCGCFRREFRRTHGLSDSRLYDMYGNIRARCYNKSHNSYKNYGARGISVCQEWLGSFEAFATWALRNGYREDLEIDRIDVNGNYEPSNCRFVTPQENRSVNLRRQKALPAEEAA